MTPSLAEIFFLHGKAEFETKYDGTKERLYRSTMGSDLAVVGYPKVKAAIRAMSNSELSDDREIVAWYSGSEACDGKKSFVGGLIAYSDKTNATRWKLFYPVHIFLMNFSDEYRQKMIDKGHTIVAFLPTSVPTRGGMKLDRTVKQTVLHKCLRLVFYPLAKRTLTGITSSDENLVCHDVLVEYVTDFPEGKDLSCTFNSIKTALPCTGCTVPRGSLIEFTGDNIVWREHLKVSAEREKATAFIQQADALKGKRGVGPIREQGKNILTDNSISLVRPFYENWCFLDGKLHHLLDAHRIFGFERLHNLPMGLEKILIESSMNFFTQANIVSSSMKNAKGEGRRCSPILPTVISKINMFLTETHHFSPMPNLRLDFEANGGLFTKKGAVGMLEAKELLSVPTVFPFIGFIFDSFLGWIGDGHFIELFTL